MESKIFVSRIPYRVEEISHDFKGKCRRSCILALKKQKVKRLTYDVE